MKKILFFLLTAIVALSFGSCTKFQSAGPDSERFFVIKKVDGKVQYGAAFKDDVQLFLPIGKYSYGKLKIPESYLCVPCKYDDIEYTKVGETMMFVCHKDKQMFLYDAGGSPYAGGQPITKIDFLGRGRGSCFGTKWEYKFHTPAGVYNTVTGPYEDLSVGFCGYAIKKNGKWGYMYGRYDSEDEPQYRQIVPCQYDEIIEADAYLGFSMAVVRQGNNWIAYDDKGQPKKVSTEFVRYLKKIKDKNTSEPFFFLDYGK